MKTSVKIAIIGAIATVAAAVIPVVISIVIHKNDKNGNSEKPRVTPSSEYHQEGNISVEESKNIVVGNITTGKFEDALKSYKEALETYRKLAQANPQTYLPDVAMTLINLSVFYQESQPDKDVSVQYAMEALKILTPFLESVPYTQQYAQRARQVLQKWGVDIEKVLAEKDR